MYQSRTAHDLEFIFFNLAFAGFSLKEFPMALLSLRNINLTFGLSCLLQDAALHIEKGERVCLLGRNGTGKSTLLGLISGAIKPDSGVVEFQQGTSVALLPQEVPQAMAGTVFEAIANGVGPLGKKLCAYHELSRALEQGNNHLLDQFLEAQHVIDSEGGWPLERRIEQVVSRLKLIADAPVATLSGGLTRRVLLARVLAAAPDIMLLDEPTNHLDIESILWLEEFVLRETPTMVFITHDRSFLRRIATRIVEIDRGHLFDFPCDYETYLKRKDELLNAEQLERARFDKKLAEEEIWVRRGIKARRTRNEGRVRALQKMREERIQRRERDGAVQFKLHEAPKSGKLVVEVQDISFGYEGRSIINDFSTTILRGDRIGIIGPNGAGKTTLLKLLMGELSPQSGSVKLGTNIEVLYFDQLRNQLDPNKTVQQNLSGDQDTVIVGEKSRHVIGYLKDFLFTPDRAHTPVRVLSGGERNRLLLARLFAKQANVLILDEPTNDLDLETLDLVEELLAEFQGTVFLVSHDRDFLNQVVTSTIVFEDDGKVAEYVGGYDDWLKQRQPLMPAASKSCIEPKKSSRTAVAAIDKPLKLSFKERRELEELPKKIESLETEQAQLYNQMASPSFYRESSEQVTAAKVRLKEVEAAIGEAYARWEKLEAVERISNN